MKNFIPAVCMVAVALSVYATPCFADDSNGGSASSDLTTVEGAGSAAASPGNSDESAKSGANQGWDTPASSEPPPVHLNCDPCVVDPADLKKDDPPPVSLHPSYVPPLPPSE